MRARLLMGVALATLAGCGGGSMNESTPPPVQPAAVNFTAFTEQLLRIQSETAQPTSVTTTQFEFPDNDNPQAFAAVLPGI